MEWRIVPQFEKTQSSNYMPLICSVIDTFRVEFPPGYEDLFNDSVRDYKRERMDLVTTYKLPFDDFRSFQAMLRGRVNTILGGTTTDQFQAKCDSPYHIVPAVQTAIIGDAQNFLQLFISRLKERMSGKQSRLIVGAATGAADGRGAFGKGAFGAVALGKGAFGKGTGAATGAADGRGTGAADGRGAFGKGAFGAVALGKGAFGKGTGAATGADGRGTGVDKRWYVYGEGGVKIPYPSDISALIDTARQFDQPAEVNLNGQNYFIDPKNMVQRNKNTNVSRRIVNEGGKRKRRKTKNKKTKRKN
jgi:hypothetical protein